MSLSTAAATRPGAWAAAIIVISPPIEAPTNTARSICN